MKRKTITIQFIQNGIILLSKELNNYQLESVDNYKIINREKFISEMNEILKKTNINNSLLTDNINIIIDNTYSELDKENINDVFIGLSFNKIKFLELTKLFNVKIYYIDEVIDQKIYFNKYDQILSILIKNIISIHNIKTIKLFGNKCNNKKIISILEKYSSAEVYIYSQPHQVPITLLT